MKILIINAGGNILSLKNILFHCGFEAKIYDEKDTLSDFDLVFLPGVGAEPDLLAIAEYRTK